MNKYNDTELRLLEVEVPKQTNRYAPVPHRVFIEELQSKLEKRNLQILQKRYASSCNGEIMMGEFVIYSDADPELYTMCSFINSYNKQQRASLLAGAYQKVCENGLYLNTTRFRRKHTGSVLEELYSHMDGALDSAEEQLNNIIRIKTELKNISVSKKRVAELLGTLYIEKNIITSTQLNIVKRELETPTYNYECPGTAFELMSHLTHSFKNSQPRDYMKAHIETSDFFVNEFGILTTPNKTIYTPAPNNTLSLISTTVE